MSAPRPYPFDALARIEPSDVALLRATLRRLPPGDPEALSEVFAELLGVSPELVMGSPHTSSGVAVAAAAADNIVAIRLLCPRSSRAVVLTLDARLAHALTERTLGSDGDTFATPGPRLAPAQRGVLAYLAARALAHGGRGWTAAALTSGRGAFAALLPDTAVLRLPFVVRLGALRGGASLLWSDDDGRALTPRPARFAHLASLPLRCSLTAGKVTLAAATCRDLSPGDIVVLDEAHVDVRAQGRTTLVALGASTPRYECELDAGSLRLTTIDRPAPAAVSKGAALANEDTDTDAGDTQTAPSRPGAKPNDDALRAAAGDAPIQLALELARIELRLDELAALRPGEVVVTGVPTRGPVTLRAGDRAVATGELVDVDGELGVRVLELAD